MEEMALFKCFLSSKLLWEIFLGILFPQSFHRYLGNFYITLSSKNVKHCEEYKEIQDRILILWVFISE